MEIKIYIIIYEDKKKYKNKRKSKKSKKSKKLQKKRGGRPKKNKIKSFEEGPKGTFGQMFWSKDDPSLGVKHILKSKSKLRNQIKNEFINYQDLEFCIKELKLTNIRTVKVSERDDKSFFIQRIYPPKGVDSIVQMDFSNIFDDFSTNSWKILKPVEIIERGYLTKNEVEKIAYELGCLWIGMIILKKKVLWEPELVIGKLYNEERTS